MDSVITDGLSESGAVLIGMFISCVLYGAFVVLFLGTLYVFFYKRKAAPNVPLLIASLLIFLFSTANVFLGCLKAYHGFILTNGNLDPDEYFLQTSWTYSLEVALLIAESLVADFIMIHRCYAVWSYSRRIIAFSVLLWLSCIAIGIVYTIVGTGTQTGAAWMVNTQEWAVVYTSLTFAQNVICTALTAYRLWIVEKAAAAYRNHSLTPIIWVIVESGALYSATLLVFLVLEVLGLFTISNLFIEIFEPLIGITFALIIVRVNLGLTKDAHTPTIGPSTHTRPTESVRMRPIHTINIKVHRDIEVEGDATGTRNDSVLTSSREIMDDTCSSKHSGRQDELEI